MLTPLLPRRRVELFSVEPEVAQVVWRDLSPPVEIRRAGAVVGRSARSAAAVLVALGPAGHDVIEVRDASGRAQRLDVARPSPLEGPELARIATISDLHLGADGFGLLRPIPDRRRAIGRCAEAAVVELTEWGAELVILKGDLTQSGRPDEVRAVAAFLEALPVPAVWTLGNHDVRRTDGRVGRERLRQLGLDCPPVQVVDLPDVRVLVADTTVDARGYGRIRHIVDELTARAAVDRPVFIALHHHMQGSHVPWFWPPGIPKAQSARAIARLAEVNERIYVSSGHSHRLRRHMRHGIPLTEVSSVKDFPGVWAGYRFHPSGVHQTVRRIADAEAFAWTERTRGAVGGIWARWSPGALEERSFFHAWDPAWSPAATVDQPRSIA